MRKINKYVVFTIQILTNNEAGNIIDISIVDISIRGVLMERMFNMLLYRAFHAQRNYLRKYLTELDLGTGQPKLLTYINNRGSCRPKELADYFEIDPAAVSRMLDLMKKSGLIDRRTDESNRRSDIVELTQKGKEVNEKWLRHCIDMQSIMLKDFTEEEQGKFAEYLSRAYQNLKKLDGGNIK